MSMDDSGKFSRRTFAGLGVAAGATARWPPCRVALAGPARVTTITPPD
jgi:hypothetical protein